ncbi:MAG: hypothetical protein HY861_04750 [Chlamydiia bacterium]|nr:hypothetical protein [Chlamydiia bacterium]
MIGQEILMEIDSTLDRLIRNAEVIQTANLKEISETEIEAFQKTQESLIQHLIHMDQLFETKTKTLGKQDRRSAGFKIQEKLLKFEKLKGAYHKTIAETMESGKRPVAKRRGKRFLCTSSIALLRKDLIYG